ncbi:MAG TPA: hypothetical protein VGN72_07685 [Tepidisphaeraceae bacterium]|jgi:hypothetical protein|nr:hypothetical protein [Tepidisphaeraceae bacterium]
MKRTLKSKSKFEPMCIFDLRVAVTPVGWRNDRLKPDGNDIVTLEAAASMTNRSPTRLMREFAEYVAEPPPKAGRIEDMLFKVGYVASPMPYWRPAKVVQVRPNGKTLFSLAQASVRTGRAPQDLVDEWLSFWKSSLDPDEVQKIKSRLPIRLPR